MAKSDIEIEIKVQVEKLAPLLNFLKHHGKFISKTHQIDEYFTPAHRNFTSFRPVSEWLRLRSSGNTSSLNYKNYYHDKSGKSTYCDEYESRLENMDQVKKIFSVLNLKSLVVVDKIRQTWTYKKYEIAIDKVRNLGDFVEIEFKGQAKSSDHPRLKTEMLKFLKDLGCGQLTVDYRGYPFLLLFPSEHLSETI